MLDTPIMIHFILLGVAVMTSFRFPLISATLLIVSILLGYVIGLIEESAILVLLIFYGIAWCLPKSKQFSIGLSRVLHAIFILISIGLAAHFFPGFNNYLTLDNVQKSSLSIPYSLYLNVDKLHVFFAVLIAIRTYAQPWKQHHQAIKFMALTVILLILLQAISIPMGLMKFDLGLPEWTLIWVFSNLLFTCAAEEAFFRHYLQRQLQQKFSAAFAVIAVGILFGVAHFSGGPLFIFFATLAGIGYGSIYYFSGGRLFPAMLAHFVFNLVHLNIFTYPLPI